jgi:hypothetical protein
MNFFSCRVVCLFWLIIPSSLLAVPLSFISQLPFTISLPGLYVLSDNISFSTSSTAITINSDKVILDLNGKTIGATVSSTNGVAILSGSTTTTREHIVIKNGALIGFDGFGVTGSGTLYSDIKVQDITVIGVAGTSTGISFANTTDSAFERCRSVNNFLGAQFTSCHEVDINASHFNNNRGTDGVFGLAATSCSNFTLIDCTMNNNVATNGASGGAMGMVLTGVGTNWVCKNCTFNNNTAGSTGASFARGLIATTHHTCYLLDCSFNDNSTTNTFSSSSATGNIAGAILTTCSGWRIEGCDFSRNSVGGGTATVSGVSVTNGGSHFIGRCNFANNISNETTAVGFCFGLLLSGASSCEIRDSIANGNAISSSASFCYGFRLVSSSRSNSFFNCKAMANSGGTGAVHGFELVSTASDNSFVQCSAMGQLAATSRGFVILSGGSANAFHQCQALGNGTNGFLEQNAAGQNSYTGCLAARNVTNYTAGSIRYVTISETNNTNFNFNTNGACFGAVPGTTAFVHTDIFANYEVV